MLGRVIAVLVMIASAGVIAWHHRDDLMPAPIATLFKARADALCRSQAGG